MVQTATIRPGIACVMNDNQQPSPLPGASPLDRKDVFSNAAAEAIAESERKYRTIVENINDGLNIHDFKGKLLDVNDSLCKMLGYTREELVGSHLSKISGPENQQKFPERMRTLLDTGTFLFEGAHLRKDGSAVFTEINARVVSREGDGVIQSFIRDISDRKKAEAALKASEEKFSVAFDHSPLLKTISEIETGVFIEVNRKFLEVSGFSRDEVIGKSSVAIGWISALERKRIIDTIREKGNIENLELACRTKDNRLIYCQYFAEIINIDGKPRLLAAAQDITEKKRTETALRENDKMLKKAQMLAHIGHFRYDPATGVVEGSDVLFSIFGLSREEFAFDSFVNVVHPDDREFVTSTIKNSVDNGVPYEIEHWLQCKNSEKKFINAIGEPELDDAGKTTLLVGTVQDITERKLMESVLAESEKRYRLLFENMVEGFSVHEIITDASGVPVDFRFIDMNTAHERHSGLKRSKVIGKTIKEIMPSVNDDQIVRYGKVALTGEPISFEYFSPAFNRHFRISAFSPQRRHFATIFEDITDTKKSELALRESEERFRQLAENIHAVFWIGSPDWKQILYVSPAYQELWGRSCESLYEQPLSWLEALPFEDMEKTGAAMESIADADWTTLRFPEFRVRRPDGSVRWVAATVYPIRNEKKEIVRLAGLAEDITGRKNIQDALRHEQEMARLYFDIAGVMLLVLDPGAQILLINKKGCSMLGYAEEELIGQNWIDRCILPEQRTQVKRIFARIMAGETADFAYAENIIVCKNGLRRLIAWNNEVVRDDQGAVAAAISSGEDITGRRRAETALAESERRNRELLDAVPDLIFKIAGSGAILDFKYDTPDQLFLPPDKVKGANIFDLSLSGGDLANIKRAVSTAMTTGKKQTCTYSIPFHGSDHIFEARIIREMEDTAVVIVRDITESKRAEENMIKTEKLESLGYMAGGIAHDFNNLLGGVFGYLEMAKEQAEADNLKRTSLYLSKALTVFDRAKGLTRQFLTFAKGGAPLKKTGDLAILLRNSVPFALSGSNVEYDLQLPNDLWPCDFDEHQMGQVVDNLVINAKQAMDKGGRLEVSAENIKLKAEDKAHSLLPGRYVRIDFKDNGPGISKELHRKIFDPFFTTKKTGTGLGLATTYSIITKHGGHIELVSEPGKGADFFIFLPASGKTVKQNETDMNASAKGSGRILLMDDEHCVRDVGSTMLKNLGYAVETAKNGEDAIALYEEALKVKKPFKAAIFDLTVIGGMGGKDAAARIRELDPQARLIVSSGYSEDPVMANPRHYGFSACIGKPYRKEELAQVLLPIAAPGNDLIRKSGKAKKQG
jgi:two-component system, cell cycle sensor histidine kinase and response regulator CckA